MIKNKYECGSALWSKFTDQQKETYNHFRALTLDDILPITNSSVIHNNDWSTISHNFAVFAAMEHLGKKAQNDLERYIRKQLHKAGSTLELTYQEAGDNIISKVIR